MPSRPMPRSQSGPPCAPCHQPVPVDPEAARPRRIVALQAWFAGDRVFRGEFAGAAELIEWWRGLPDDGALAFRAWFNHRAPVRLGARLSGCRWYFLLAQEDAALDGDDGPPEEIRRRYPQAILKRGQLVGIEEMRRVNEALRAATYWAER